MRARALAFATPVLALAVLSIGLLPAAAAAPTHSASGAVGEAFVLSNNASGNAVIAFDRASSGALTWVANYPAGGNGTGASLADQGSIVLTANDGWLLAVDAGTNQISVFQVHAPGSSPLLTRTAVVGSGGVGPVSLTVHDNLVFVVNVGSATVPGNIAGFALSSTGTLRALPGSHAPLSTSGATGAAEIAFNPAGHILVVAEKATSVLDLYRVNPHGVVTWSANYTSYGNTPYGFAFDRRGHLIVSEAGPGSLSSYAVWGPVNLATISGSVSDTQAAPCWVATTAAPRGGSYAFTTNAHSDSISSYWVGVGGKLTLLGATAATTGAAPTDEAVAANGGQLLVYDAGSNEVQSWGIGSDGSLTWIQNTTGLPATAEGLAAF